MQSSSAVHLGADNMGVVRHVGRLLDGRPGSIPIELVKDGDLLLLLLIDRMLHLRGLDTVRITMRVETNSNDFGGFWNKLADSNSIFFVAKIIIFLNDSNFWCVQSSTTHSGRTCACAVACLHPHNSIPNVVVSVTIHDNI